VKVAVVKRLGSILVVGAVAFAACSGADSANTEVSAPDIASATTDPANLTTGIVDPQRPDVIWVSANVDGTAVRYALVDPVPTGGEAPLLLALPPGPQTERLVGVGLDRFWTEEAVKRGWRVVSPVAPDGQLFFQGAESVIPGLLEQVMAALPTEGIVAHVAGISNGGISSFRIAAEFPHLVASITTLPGFPINFADLSALDALDAPITMWAGEDDTRWVEEMLGVESRLTPLGKQVTATVLPGVGHIIDNTAEFVADVWTALESARAG